MDKIKGEKMEKKKMSIMVSIIVIILLVGIFVFSYIRTGYDKENYSNICQENCKAFNLEFLQSNTNFPHQECFCKNSNDMPVLVPPEKIN